MFKPKTSFLPGRRAKQFNTGNILTNFFSNMFGTLRYSVTIAIPMQNILHVDTVDEYNVQEPKLEPRYENSVKDRMEWFAGKGVGR
jgi:hypothetical protein